MSEPVTRRTFLGNGGKIAVGLTAAAAATGAARAMLHHGAPPLESVAERLNFALIGCGGMGNVNLHDFMKSKMANISLRCRSKVYWDAERKLCFWNEALTESHDAANKLLAREYRQGFELPQV